MTLLATRDDYAENLENWWKIIERAATGGIPVGGAHYYGDTYFAYGSAAEAKLYADNRGRELRADKRDQRWHVIYCPAELDELVRCKANEAADSITLDLALGALSERFS